MMRTCALILALMACLAGAAAAQMPPLLSYQGVLTDATGTAVPDGTYSITFRIYDVGGTGGTALWTEIDYVTVTKGTFNALLGGTAMLSVLSFDETYYIGLSIEGGPELPRQVLARSPYSFSAHSVTGTENVFPSAGKVGIGTKAPAVPLHVTSESGQVGIQFDGYDDAWASIYVNAARPTAAAGFGYNRFGILGAFTYLDAANNWNLRMGGSTSAITASPAGNVSIGALPPSLERLSIDGALQLGNAAGSTAGTIRWSGSDFEGYNGSAWQSFTATGAGLPSGSPGQTLRHDGADWVAASNLYNDGTNIGIGTTTPATALHVQTAGIRGITLDGQAGGSWSLMNINAAGINSSPGIELARQGSVKSLVYVDPSDDLHFTMTGADGLVIDGATRNVGLGVSAPQQRLDVSGALRLGTTGSALAGTIRWSGSDFEGYNGSTWQSFTATGAGLPLGVAGLTLRHNGSDWIASANLYNDGSSVGIGTMSPEAMLHVNGDARIGSSGATGSMRLFRGGQATPFAASFSDPNGGYVETYDESNGLICAFRPSWYGLGGVLGVTRPGDYWGLYVDGNSNGTGQPAVSIMGSDRYAIFDMSQEGENSVWLPNESVSSVETSDEPGVASYTSQYGIGLGTSLTTIASQSITTPGAGYILVIATCNLGITHVNGVASHGIIGTSNNALSLPDNQDLYVDYPATAATGSYFVPATCHGLYYNAYGGTFTYYLLGRRTDGAFNSFENQLSLVYIPTAYGSVQPTLAGVRSSTEKTLGAALTAQDVAAQKTASEAANTARIEKELQEMKARLAALETQVKRE